MPFPSDPNPWSFYRLGPTKEKELFKRRKDTYDGVVIPAHIASYYYKFCSEFIGSLGKPYFIDPMTYIFAGDPALLKRFVKDKTTGKTAKDRHGRKKKGDVKRSYAKLVEDEYGGLIQRVVSDDRPLSPRDFDDGSEVNELVQKIVAFQRDRLAAIPEKYKKYEKYAKKSGKNLTVTGNQPMCVVAPYFPTDTLDSRGWYTTNVDLIRRTKAVSGNLPVFGVVLAQPAILDKAVIRIAKDYKAAGADGFLLWPDGFSSDQDPAALRIVFNTVEQLKEGGTPVILMYGDAFSLVLHFAGLAGYACGICYGERKLSTQDIDVEGVIPPRYYLRNLKKKVQIETEARRIRIADYPDLVCACEICGRKPDPVTLDDTESREHFMLVRADEIAELRGGLSQASYAAALSDTYEAHRADPLLRPIGHLRNWAELLVADKIT